MKAEILLILGAYLYSILAGVLIGMKLSGVVAISWFTALVPFALPFVLVAIWIGFLMWFVYESSKDYESE